MSPSGPMTPRQTAATPDNAARNTMSTSTVMVDGKPQDPHRGQSALVTHVRGRVTRFFDDVLVLASKSLPKRSSPKPWSPGIMSRLAPYQPKYLAGFRAEAYAIELRRGVCRGARAKHGSGD